MYTDNTNLMNVIRMKFEYVESCPYQGERIFFENAGGALTLKSVLKRSTELAAVPDNQGRVNQASEKLVNLINQAKENIRLFFNTKEGNVFVGESGTELLFRLIRTALVESKSGGSVVGSSLEHPASTSACIRWSRICQKKFSTVPHNLKTASVSFKDYFPYLNNEVRVATIIHTSPVTGVTVDLKSISKEIRKISPECFIIVDGIQHAAHGHIDINDYDIDGYVISPYKVFSRHGYGIAWISDRLAKLPHDMLAENPTDSWELGTRDTASYATFSDVVEYFDWLGSQFTSSNDRRARIEAAGEAIKEHEKRLINSMIFGFGNIKGLSEMDGIHIIGGNENSMREGMVSINVSNFESDSIVSKLSKKGIRVHTRKADHYSKNILEPLGMRDCVRVSLGHYNNEKEVGTFLLALDEILSAKS